MSRLSHALVIVALLLTSCSVATTDVVMTSAGRPPGAMQHLATGAGADQLADSGAAALSAVDPLDPAGAVDGDSAVVAATGTAQDESDSDAETAAAVDTPPPPPDQATRDAFFEVAGPAHGALLSDTVYQVVLDRTLQSDGVFDLSSRATVLVDEIGGSSSVELALFGSTWELARSGELLTPPWKLSEPPSGATQLDPFRQAAHTEVDEFLRGFANLMSVDSIVAHDGDGRFEMAIPHRDLLARAYGGAVSPWTSLLVVQESLDWRALPGTSPVALTFVDGLLRRVEIDYGPLLAAAVDAEASLPFTAASFREVYEITFSEGIHPEQARYAVGECYNGDSLPWAGEPSTPCSEPHLYEILSVGPAGFGEDDGVPSQDEVNERLLPVCSESFRALTGHDPTASIFGISSRAPSLGQWERGERNFTCYVRLRVPIAGRLASLDVHRHQDRVSPAGMQVGDCVDGLMNTEVARLLVDCAAEHEGQVFFVTAIEQDGPRPTAEWFTDYAVDACGPAFGSLQTENGIDVNATALGMQRMIPSDRMWDAGERFLVCIVASDRPLKGSMVVGG